MNYMSSLFTLTMLLLLFPLILPTNYILNSYSYTKYIKNIVASSFFISILPMTMFLMSNEDTIIINWHWINIHNMNLHMSFKLDYFSLLFIPVALYVTWSIMEFSMWYMHSDPNINKFMKYLLMFLITMMILVTANNMFQLFIGWEGVGIMSFLLIGWWHGRSDANTAALQAILYNRIGDIGFLLAMIWYAINLNSWEMQQIFLLPTNDIIPLMGLLLAAMGKSAQFGLHPWLPSAMEGPTPVSALLHSSTMVVAGVFLLIRFHSTMYNYPSMQTMILCLGALTTLFSALCAITQNDIKKIVAFSTSSQLGLMMVTIGLNQPHLAFLHICTHAFFKAMLFMCSGSIIHNLNDEQDIRKMGGLMLVLPFTSSSLMIGSLALTGIPFLTGFYSKDLIIEFANTSYTNAWALTLTLIATSLTAVYSTRIIFFSLMGQPRFTTSNLINENIPPMMNSIKRLLLGSIFAGFMLSSSITPVTIPQMTMPNYLKLTALIVTILGFTLAMELNTLTNNLKHTSPSLVFSFSNSLGYYPTIIHRFPPLKNLNLAQKMATTRTDLTLLELFMPSYLCNIQITMSKLISNQKGLMKLYFLTFMFSIMISLAIILPLSN
uniref:NADH-ubiquinone oxidoreductase chain 5 n=1 Tax=Echinosorex gymnura TaxID=162630 RepID=Q953L0_ECHGY|nr:NADH dehydrogenase subunit 5 [Echinosorex gymnura]AAK64231.1 NADH dehydrogenase subunit 5 [Echinosorex gymnura]